MAEYDTLAVRLHASPFREADLLVNLYSRDYGVIRAVVKGAKKPMSKLAGVSEPMTLNHVYLAKGRGLHTVCHTERKASYTHLRGDIERLAVGSVCTEVLQRIGREHDPDSAIIFDALNQAFIGLDDLNQPWAENSIRYHLQLLRQVGYLPDFGICEQCQAPLDLEASSYYAFSLKVGGFLCRRCQAVSKDLDTVNVSTKTIHLFLDPSLSFDSPQAIKAHKFLAYYWQARLEAPLKSFDFLFQVLEPLANRLHQEDQ